MKYFLVNTVLLHVQAQQIIRLYPAEIPADPENNGNLKHPDLPALAV